ncbi:hypothetical protein TNCV_748391 [Trichonephila clavipes]|nr:hypothetical protein TNCV_748391 [Trichonephila clavipes]
MCSPNHLKLQDTDHELDANQPYPTRAQQAIYPVNKQVKEDVACVGGTEVLNSLCNMQTCIILLKDSSRDALKERNDFRLFTDVPIAIEITLICSTLDRP